MFNSIIRFISGLKTYFPQHEVSERAKVDFVDLIPQEVSHKIFSYLNSQELTGCSQVSKTWKLLASDEALWNALSLRIAFGKKQWETYFGDIGKAPPLPKDFYKILKSPCPFWPGKKVEETHMLVLIPETVNGKPLNLKTLGELVKAPKEGHPTHLVILDMIIDEHDNQTIAKSHWVLMTKDIIEGSGNKSYWDQQALIAKLNKQTGMNYEVPNVLDAAICISMHYIHFGERLFIGDDLVILKWSHTGRQEKVIYTRCQEKIQGNQVVIGGFSSKSFKVHNKSNAFDIFKIYNFGVAALWKFF
jgi:F-box-like